MRSKKYLFLFKLELSDSNFIIGLKDNQLLYNQLKMEKKYIIPAINFLLLHGRPKFTIAEQNEVLTVFDKILGPTTTYSESFPFSGAIISMFT